MEITITNISALAEAIITALLNHADTLSAILSSSLTTYLAAISSMFGQVMLFIVAVFITVLAYWHRDWMLHIISGLALITFGVSFIDTNMYMSMLLIALGIYGFFKARWDKRG